MSPSETWSLNTTHIGRRVNVFETLASTNTTASELAVLPENDGVVVIADYQTTGRGQYGRVWQSRPKCSLLMSVVLNPPSELCRPAILTALAAVAVVEAIVDLSGIQASIKWPNDVLIRGKKVCGILIEKHGSAAVVGIGLNINQTAEEFIAAGLLEATSLEIESTRPIERRFAVERVIQRLDQAYEQVFSGERTAIEAEWKERIGLIGRRVLIEHMDGSTIVGQIREMQFDRLVLELEDGTRQMILPETVRHIFEQ